jgi:hypothetical protein
VLEKQPLGVALVIGLAIGLVASIVVALAGSGWTAVWIIAGLFALAVVGLVGSRHRVPAQHLVGTRVKWVEAGGWLWTGTVVSIAGYRNTPPYVTARDTNEGLHTVSLTITRFPLGTRLRYSWRRER